MRCKGANLKVGPHWYRWPQIFRSGGFWVAFSFHGPWEPLIQRKRFPRSLGGQTRLQGIVPDVFDVTGQVFTPADDPVVVTLLPQWTVPTTAEKKEDICFAIFTNLLMSESGLVPSAIMWRWSGMNTYVTIANRVDAAARRI